MSLEFQSGFRFNSIVWITSLPADQLEWPRRTVADLELLTEKLGVPFLHYEVNSTSDFLELLDGIVAWERRQDRRPIVHLYMHGSPDGLEMAGTRELAPWSVVLPKLQAINVAAAGNLCVVANACYAYRAIKAMKGVNEPCPVYALIGPDDVVYVDFLKLSTVKFYEEIFSTRHIGNAYEKYLSAQLKIFYSDHFLAVVLGRYIRNACQGKGAATRHERLLTEILSHGEPDTPENRERIRALLQKGTRPDQALVDRYAGTFLVGRPCPFTLDQLLQFIDDADNSEANDKRDEPKT